MYIQYGVAVWRLQPIKEQLDAHFVHLIKGSLKRNPSWKKFIGVRVGRIRIHWWKAAVSILWIHKVSLIQQQHDGANVWFVSIHRHKQSDHAIHVPADGFMLFQLSKVCANAPKSVAMCKQSQWWRLLANNCGYKTNLKKKLDGVFC